LPPEKEFRHLDSWKRREDLNFWIKIESAKLYMAEHSSSTIYFLLLTCCMPLYPNLQRVPRL